MIYLVFQHLMSMSNIESLIQDTKDESEDKANKENNEVDEQDCHK